MQSKIRKRVFSIMILFGLMFQIGLPLIFAEEESEETWDSMITAFMELPNEIANQTIMVGASESNIILPDTLLAAFETEEIMIDNIRWILDIDKSDCDVFDLSEAMKYVYLPLLPGVDNEGNELILGEGVRLPEICVLVEEIPIGRVYSSLPETHIYDISDGHIAIEKGRGNTLKVTYGDGIVQDNISNGTMLTLTGKSNGGAITITGVTANITFDNLTIIGPNTVSILGKSDVNLTLKGNSVLRNTTDKVGDNRGAGLGVDNGSELTITVKKGNEGTITATGRQSGAGIGGGYKSSGGVVTIEGGTVIAIGGINGAGIGGGGYSSLSGTVIIKGGTVIATGGENAAGIGSGSRGLEGVVEITGGSVQSTGGKFGGGIGGGNQKSGGTINISGGTVITTGGQYGSGIGGGWKGSGGELSIKGGTVTATGGLHGAGIGGGKEGLGGTFTAEDGNAFIIASSIQDKTYIINSRTQGIIFDGSTGTIYGKPVINWNATIPVGCTLTVEEGMSFIINSDVTITNNGILIINDGGRLEGGGKLSGNGEFISLDKIELGLSSNTYTGEIITWDIVIRTADILGKKFNIDVSKYKPDFKKRSIEGEWFSVEEIIDAGTYRAVFTKGVNVFSKEFTIAPKINTILNLTVIDGTGSGSYNEGDLVNIRADNPRGYTFIGWTSEEAVTFASSFDRETTLTMPNKDIIIRANYSEENISKYTVIFLDHDGTVLSENKVLHGEGVRPPSAPTRYGYIFAGWDGLFDKIIGDTRVTAKYIKDSNCDTGNSKDESVPGRNEDRPSTTLPPEPRETQKPPKETTRVSKETITARKDAVKVNIPQSTILNAVKSFLTDYISKLAIEYKENKSTLNFTDIENHWAKDDIEFVVARGLFSGTGDEKFSPNIPMTRGMFLRALGRLANVDVGNYKESKFTDVKSDTYYMAYIEWASDNGIIEGVGDREFAPSQSITREQMAVILSNYARAIGFQIPKKHEENNFIDDEEISNYAGLAIKEMQMSGIIYGKGDKKFDPKGKATGGEICAVLKRFIELVENK